MRVSPRTLSGFCVALVLISMHTAPVRAALGGDASTVDADRVRMRGSLLRIVRSDAYTIHEIRSESGTTVREFISPAGKVFAVAWEGEGHPDMEQILGAHFARYQQGAQSALKQRRPPEESAGAFLFSRCRGPVRRAVPHFIQEDVALLLELPHELARNVDLVFVDRDDETDLVHGYPPC